MRHFDVKFYHSASEEKLLNKYALPHRVNWLDVPTPGMFILPINYSSSVRRIERVSDINIVEYVLQYILCVCSSVLSFYIIIFVFHYYSIVFRIYIIARYVYTMNTMRTLQRNV